MEQQIVGLDVSKAWLDGYLASSGRRLRVSNDAAGHRRTLVRTLGDRAGCLVVMEASGGYERTAHRELVAQGVLAAIVNPKRVRDFARGMGLEAKTDRVDARLIARYGEVMRPAATPAARPGAPGAARDPGLPPPADRRDHRAHAAARAAAEPGDAGAGRARPWSSCARRPRSSPGSCGRRIQADAALAADFALLTSHARLRPDPGRHPAGRDARARQPRPPQGREPSPASPRSPGTAACASTAASSRAAAARSAAPSTWPPSPRLKTDRPARSRPATTSSSPEAKPPKLALTALMRNMLVTLNAMLKTRQAWKDPRET